MECRDAQFYLRFRRLDPDELGQDLTGTLDRHLAACPHCAADSKSAIAFDTALASAMQAVTIPAGLRERLIANVSAQRGAILRRKAYRYAAVAASLLLAVGIGIGAFTASRPQLDTASLAMQGDALIDHRTAEAAVRNWLATERLPTQLPEPFDFSLLLTYGTEKVQGRDVPVVVFRDRQGPGFAKVYVFRSTLFDTRGVIEAQASHCQVRLYPDRATGTLFAVVFTGQDLTPFLRGQGPLVSAGVSNHRVMKPGLPFPV